MKELFPENYSILLVGPPGVGKFEYCLDLIQYYLGKAERAVYITTERSPEEIKERAKGYGISLEQYEGKNLIFIDCYSWSIGGRYEKGLNVDNPANLSQINLNIEKAVTRLKPPTRIIFDSLSPLFLHNSQEVMTKFFQILTSKVKTEYGFILYTLQEGVHDPQIVNTLVYLSDGLLEMRFTGGEVLKRQLRVHHLKGISVDVEWKNFTIEKGFKFL